MVVLVMFQVLARYVFRAVPVWTEEAARYCMVWGGLFGATVAFHGDLDPRLIQPPKAQGLESLDHRGGLSERRHDRGFSGARALPK